MPTHQHLDRVEIRRFRGLSELDLDSLGSFNVLLGANDVGKTSVLEALFHQLDPDQPIELVAHSAGTIVRRTVRISAPYTEIELDSDAPAPWL